MHATEISNRDMKIDYLLAFYNLQCTSHFVQVWSQKNLHDIKAIERGNISTRYKYVYTNLHKILLKFVTYFVHNLFR